MPLYEYRCPASAARFEVLQRMGEGAGELACPSCGGQGVERQLSTFAAAVGGGHAQAAPAESFGCAGGGCGGGACGMPADWN